MQTTPSWKELAKNALMMALVGLAVNLLTIAFEATITWLQSIPEGAPGTLVGVGGYILRLPKLYQRLHA